jgi:hypothetical protein
MFAFITVLARRWRSYWWTSMAFIVAGGGSLALGSYLAVRSFMSSIAGMATTGGGIYSVWFGCWQSTQPVLAGAWLAMLMTLFGGVFVLRGSPHEITLRAGVRSKSTAIFALFAGLALTGGAASVVLYRRAITFVLWAITPQAQTLGHPSTPLHDVTDHLFAAAAVSACCLTIVIVLLVSTVLIARRTSPSRTFFVVTVIALLASFGISGAFVVNLHSLSNRFRTAALTGKMSE